jgi:hypothetical protein
MTDGKERKVLFFSERKKFSIFRGCHSIRG